MKLIEKICDICKVKLSGYGLDHFNNNKDAHMLNEHGLKEEPKKEVKKIQKKEVKKEVKKVQKKDEKKVKK